MKEDLIDVLAPSFANRQNCSHNRAAKHIKISCRPRESSLNHSWPSWILPQAISDLHLSCPWFLAELDYGSNIPRAFRSQAPRNARVQKTQSTAHVFNLTSDRFCPLLAFIKNRHAAATLGLASNNTNAAIWLDELWNTKTIGLWDRDFSEN